MWEILKTPDFVNVSKLAIDHSDAVIQGSEDVDDNVLKYVQDSDKLFLGYQTKEEYIDSYNEFYDKV